MDQPLFSIIIPAYNYAPTVERAIVSVLKQPGNDYELLVINDGSTDDTARVVEQLARKYSHQFRHISRNNRGLAATRNYGIKNSSGQFLIFLDADDEMTEDGLNVFREVLEKKPATHMIIAGHISVSPGGEEILHTASDLPANSYDCIKAYLLDKTVQISNGATALKRIIFDNYQYPESFRNSEDIPVFVYALANFSSSSTAEPAAKIHKHRDSLRHNTFFAEQVGLDLVDEVFSQKRLPEKLLNLKPLYRQQRLLSLSRTFYLSGDRKRCQFYFKKALNNDWKVLLNLSYSGKFIKSYFE